MLVTFKHSRESRGKTSSRIHHPRIKTTYNGGDGIRVRIKLGEDVVRGNAVESSIVSTKVHDGFSGLYPDVGIICTRP